VQFFTKEVIPGASACCANCQKNLKPRDSESLGKALTTLPGWKRQGRITWDRFRGKLVSHPPKLSPFSGSYPSSLFFFPACNPGTIPKPGGLTAVLLRPGIISWDQT